MGIGTGSSRTVLHGITRNPWDLGCSKGGSSVGAAAGLAASIVPIAHASDRSDSIRFSTSWCGLVGLLPSRGRISGRPDRPDQSFGLIPGFVLCRTVRDRAAALDIFPGRYPGDPFVIAQRNCPYVEELPRPTDTLRVSGRCVCRPARLLHAGFPRRCSDDQSRPAEPAAAARRRGSDGGGSIRNNAAYCGLSA
ncbi:amidase family protein [Mesorhizobium sp. ISC15]|uniref:amidase family protein n=1 Tax=Mesorhizobium sp. ISC15 TaxID=3076429 RepID=UPI00301CF919